jgi:hypothetical protein
LKKFIFTFVEQMVPSWALQSIGRIGNPVQIRDNTCCCEFHSARNLNLPNSLPLALKRWEGSVKGTSQKTCHFALKILYLQATGKDQNSFYPYYIK